jgi:competence ComEA-like helix-hairpin-helix protein
MKRHWFFLTEKLQITPAERTAVTTLIAVLVVLWSIPASWFRPEPFNQEYYAPILAEFQEKVQLREIEKEQTLARFYPPLAAVQKAEHVEQPAINHLTGDAAGPESASLVSTSTSSLPTTSSIPPTRSGTNGQGLTLTLPAGSPPSSGPVNADTVKAGGGTNPESGTGLKININTADVTELQKLPGIGPSIAARIVEYRVQNGPFRAIEEITGVRGIGEARLNSLRNSITVD